MRAKKEFYHPDKIERIRRKLEQAIMQGKPEYFAIEVDELMVVSPTNDLEVFDTYLNFLDDHARQLCIDLYGQNPDNKNGQRFIYDLPKNSKEENESLKGIDIDERIAAAQERWEAAQLKEKYSEIFQKLSEAEEYITKLEDQLITYKMQQSSSSGKGFEDIAKAVGGLFGGHSDLLSKFSPADNLSGTSKKQGEASFKKKTEVPLDEEDRNCMLVLKDMKKNFDPEQLHAVFHILQALMNKPEDIITVAELLGIKTEIKPEK